MLTIKELREKDAARLAARQNPNPTPEEIETARHAMRLYYIFVSAYQKSFFTEQEHGTPDEIRQADERSEKTYKSAAEALKPYGVKISTPGLYPIIDDMNGANFTYGHFYN